MLVKISMLPSVNVLYLRIYHKLILYINHKKVEKEWTGKRVHVHLNTLKRVTKVFCILHELGVNIINCSIAISHYLANRILRVPSFGKWCRILHFNFCNNHAQGKWTLPPYYLFLYSLNLSFRY